MPPERRDPPAAKIAVRPSSGSEKILRRAFPGPRTAEAFLRVAIERRAYADFILHAKESLEAEVCGVLVGQTCEDDAGRFVHVEAMIRGTAATQSATHVTFTQATWDAIHETLEREHPKARIVGWYHTHPGFGVEFSEMDLFIHQNFFPGGTQIAMVTDPMNGDVAIAANTPEGIKYLPRFWVDAREQMAKVPASAARPLPGGPPADTPDGAAPDLVQSVRALEARVAQLLQAHDDHRASFQRLLYTVGFAFCFGLIAIVGYFIYSQYASRIEPPRLNGFAPVPVQIGDKRVLLGVGVVEWDVPPELNSLMLQMEEVKQAREKKQAEEEKKTEETKKAAPEEKAKASHPLVPDGKTGSAP